MNAIFTIVAKNYTGLAQVLEASVRRNTDADFYIFVADEWKGDETVKASLSAHILIAKEVLGIATEEWEQMAFKYNLVEFCTAIKASCFQYLLGRGYERLVYFDPDIYVYNPLQPVFEQLNNVSIVVTPHILNEQTPFKGNYEDHLFLLNGTFNLGFIAIKNTAVSASFLKWWHHRLVHHCFFDNDRGTATDQKWINLLPAILPASEYLVTRHRGMNAAPWNFHERKIIHENGVLYVTDRDTPGEKEPLLFVHFSGYDYSQIGNGNAVHKTTSITAYPDLEPVLKEYGEALAKSSFLQYTGLVYSYNKFDNGTGIISLHRRMYRRLLEEGNVLQHPFSTGAGSYYQLLSKNGLLDHSPVSADKLTNKNVKNFDAKLAYVQLFFTFIKRIIGVRRYSIMIRFFRRFFTEENQVFLVNKEAGKKLQ
ncbi:MAG: hypothetical protein HEQ40_03810 [Lacibacter sp.]|jgi:hypothetical protein